MKRVVIILCVIVAVLLAAGILIPVAFKGPIMTKVKQTINKNVNAQVEFSDLKLSLFRGFPKVSAELRDLSVTGKDRFQNDTLLAFRSISTSLSLSDLFRGKGFSIGKLSFSDGNINLLSTRDSLVNWNIVPETGEAETPDAEEENDGLSVALDQIEIKNIDFRYRDESTATQVGLLGIRINASGDVQGTVTRFRMEGAVDEFIIDYDSVRYLGNTSLRLNSQFEADYETMNFVLGETTAFLNELPLDFSGRIAMPDDSMYFDLQFKQPQSDFATLLNMVPKTYQSYLENVRTTGTAGFEGTVKGAYTDTGYPAIDIRLFAKDATFQYEGSTEKIEKINLNGQITKPQGDFDLLEVTVRDATAWIRENPVNLKLHLSRLLSDPRFDASFNGKIDFTRLSDVIAMDSLEMKGILEGQLAVSGIMSDVEQQRYDRVKASGNFDFSNFLIKTPAITRAVEISKGEVTVSNQEIVLSSLSGKTGQSDFRLNGKLSNYLPYFFLNKTLSGDFSLNSSFLNFDELASLMAEQDSPTATANDSIVAFQVPANLNLAFRSQIARATFARLDIRNTVGLITVKDRQLVLQKLNMNLLDGELVVDGAYKSNTENKPTFDFSIQANAFKIPAAYQTFDLMRRYVPIAALSQGELSSKIQFKGQFDEKLNIIPTSLNGNGLLNTANLQIINAPIFEQLKGIIKEEKLKNIRIGDIAAQFKMDNGTVNLNPFQTKIADQDVAVSGSLSADRKLNMALDFKVNKNDLSADVNKLLNVLPGSSNISVIDATVVLTGDIKSPKVSVDLSKARKQIEEEVKKSAKDGLQKSLESLKGLFK